MAGDQSLAAGTNRAHPAPSPLPLLERIPGHWHSAVQCSRSGQRAARGWECKTTGPPPTDELHGRQLQVPVGAAQVNQGLHEKLVVAGKVALHLQRGRDGGGWGQLPSRAPRSRHKWGGGLPHGPAGRSEPIAERPHRPPEVQSGHSTDRHTAEADVTKGFPASSHPHVDARGCWGEPIPGGP